VGGSDAHRGTQRVASTLIVNPGCLAEGSAAWLDLSLPSDERVEFLDLRELELACLSPDLGAGD
jgi:hypothetical protein